jgi:hypothetical protein
LDFKKLRPTQIRDNIMLPFNNSSRVMEPETISKNGASLKSQKSKLIFLILFVATIMSTSFAQAQSEITMNNFGYWQDGKRLTSKEFIGTLSQNSEAYRMYRSGTIISAVGSIIAIPSAFPLGYGLGILIFFPKDTKVAAWPLIGIGAAGMGVGYGVLIIGQSKIKKSIWVYNEGIQRNTTAYQVTFGLTQSGGVGLTLNF